MSLGWPFKSSTKDKEEDELTFDSDDDDAGTSRVVIEKQKTRRERTLKNVSEQVQAYKSFDVSFKFLS